MNSVFDSSVEMRILVFFLLHPAERQYVKQLARELGISPGSSSVICKSLAKRGLLLQEKSGNSLFYGLNRQNAVSRELGRAAVAEKITASGAVEEFLEEDKGIISILVYGSFAKASFDKKSDLDILVISNGKKQFSKATALLEKEFRKEASLTVLAADEWGKLLKRKDPFFFNVLSDHILLYGSNPAIE